MCENLYLQNRATKQQKSTIFSIRIDKMFNTANLSWEVFVDINHKYSITAVIAVHRNILSVV